MPARWSAVVPRQGIYRRGTWRGWLQPLQKAGRVKFTARPTHLHPRQDGLCVAPRPLYRPSHSLSSSRERAQWRRQGGEGALPRPRAQQCSLGLSRENGEGKSSERLEDGEVGLQSALRAAPTPPTWPPRSQAAPLLHAPSSSSEAEQRPGHQKGKSCGLAETRAEP